LTFLTVQLDTLDVRAHIVLLIEADV
jgi:hypothetical protein